MNAFARKRDPARLARLLVSALGLAVFNLFMVVPAMVYAALLACMYTCALVFYVAGIAITASGLSGANELVLDQPLRHFLVGERAGGDANPMQTKVEIGETGIHVFQERKRDQTALAPAPAPEPDAEANNDGDGPAQVIEQAERVAGGGVRITTDLDAASRTTQTLFGLGTVMGGIVLFLLSLVVSKYTLVGIRRYIAMNFSLLKGN